MRRRVILILLGCGLASPFATAAPQDDVRDEHDARSDWRLWANIGHLLNELKQQPWDEHYGYMMDSIEKVYDRNGWTSEPDRFSFDLIREVEALPPWALQDRMDLLVEMVSDRYFLDEGQEGVLRNLFIRDGTRIFRKHSPRIMQYGMEIIQARMAGEAFTPEQVARWTKLSKPVMDDARAMMNATSKELMAELDPEQREMVERDLGAANRRLKQVEKMSKSWARGEWDPADWGMEEDPIQLADIHREEAGKFALRAEGAAEYGDPEADPDQRMPERDESRFGNSGGRAVEPPGVSADEVSSRVRKARERSGQSEDDDPWAKYVRRFITKYKLNADQEQRAWLVHRDAKLRGDRVRKRHQEQMEALRPQTAVASREKMRDAALRQTVKLNKALNRFFEQMKRRLERLPTRAQRRDAPPGDLKPKPPGKESPKRKRAP